MKIEITRVKKYNANWNHVISVDGIPVAITKSANRANEKEKANDFIRKADNANEKYCYDITETNLDSPGEEMSDLSAFMVE
ncbi:hypothetical protein [Lactiplantibacillus plantarum]|uniref:hypothetical protein n=1 Tax=Lactiplantibacillus plantarum TaxID=1590 RepID=UPI0020BD7F5B|nr:hypothetical protein [Lactiplantibacillus plantarum]